MKKTILILLAMFVAISTYADELDAAKEAKTQPAGTGLKKDGLRPFLGVTSNFTMNNNKNVIGQTDGTTFIFGVSLDGSLDYLKGANEIGFTLALNEQFSQTPILERMVKSGDLLKMDLGYLYHISDVWGPFFSASMQTSILDSYDEQATEVSYKKPDGTVEAAKNRFKLASGFSPILLKETLGLFYKPFAKDIMTLEVKAGFGAIEVMADGAYIVSDDDTTTELDLKALESYNQLGASLFFKAKGGLNLITKLTYESYLDILTPFVYNDDTYKEANGAARTSMELTNIEFSLTVSTKLLDFLGVKYQLKMMRQPQLLEGWQVQNNLFLDLSYILVGSKK